MRRLLLPLLIPALGLLPAGAGAATTHKDIAYAVHYEGTGTYVKVDRRDDFGDGTWEEQEVNLAFTFDGDIDDGVVFRDGHPFDVEADDLGDGTVTGWYESRGTGAGAERCPAVDEDPTHGWMRFTEPELAPLDGETHVFLRPFDSFDVMFDCGDSFPGAMLVQPWDFGEDGQVAPGGQQFDHELSLPPEVFGMGYVEQLVPPQVFEGARCPDFLDFSTIECRLEWSGKVVLRKLWEKTVISDGTPQPPSTATGDEPIELAPLVPPAPPAPPASDDDDLELAPLVQEGSAKLDASGRTASVTVTCGGGCAGTAAVLPAGGAARAAAAGPLAKARFRVPAGRPTRVRVKLGAKARRALRRTRRAKLRLTFTRPARSTRTFALRLPRR